jgi:DNA-binding beta-propeller fold protein YncE
MIILKQRKLMALLPMAWLAATVSVTGQTTSANTQAAEIDLLKRNGVLDRLFAQTGVYNKSKTGKSPDFVVDPAWPQSLPDSWLLGQVGGLYVDSHDNVWVYNRPRTMTTEESGLEDAAPGAKNAQGQPINGPGFPRPYGPIADCCKAAPSVLEFDAAGKLLRSWGGPADPGFIGGKCKEAAGCIWPSSEHGIYVDQKDHVWLAGNSGAAGAASPWSTNTKGGDGFVLEFDVNGNFIKRIGGTPRGPNSNDTNGGIDGTPLLYQPADMVVDIKTNRLFISDGYGNRHVFIVDAGTGKYIGSIGAYGNNPVDDLAARAAGPWMNDYSKGNKTPDFFRTPVHCVKMASDGRIYVCDRGNDRIQVFDGNDPALGQTCRNPAHAPGKCAFVAERFISEHTNTSIPGTAVSMSFSSDKEQSCLYVGDNSNMTIYILNRSNLQELGRLGRNGRMAGEFHWLHQVSVDSRGNIYTAEVDTGKRIQKFIRYGSVGCSGTGSAVVGGPAPAR